MDFSDENSLLNLFRLYLLLLHPFMQMKYRMDPQTPRFHRFLLLFTRINVAFLLSFFLLRYRVNPTDSTASLGVLFGFIFVVGFVLFAPFPSFLYEPFRSRYYLLKIKGETLPLGIDIDAEGRGSGEFI